MLDPRNLLTGSLRIAKRGVDRLGSLPGDELVLDELREFNEIMRKAGFHALFLGEPVYNENYRDPVTGRALQISIGAAPIPPLGFAGAGGFLKGGAYRMGPARTQGAEMARKYRLREARGVQASERPAGPLRSEEQFIRHFLPEVSPKEEAFRQYTMKSRAPSNTQLGPEAAKAGRLRIGSKTARMDQKLMEVEEFEDLFPQGLVEHLSNTMDPIAFKMFLDAVSDAGPRVPRYGLYESVQDAKIKADIAMEYAEETASMGGRFRDAAKLAAARISYHRSPREMFNYRFGTYKAEKPVAGQERFSTEGRSWMAERDRYLKMRFRQRMSELRGQERYYR